MYLLQLFHLLRFPYSKFTQKTEVTPVNNASLFLKWLHIFVNIFGRQQHCPTSLTSQTSKYNTTSNTFK